MYASLLPDWNVIDWSTMPRPMAAAAMVVNRSKRPKTAAASAWTRNTGASVSPMGRPTAPARRNMARKASTDATTQTTVWSRLTGMPSVKARSARSAAPTMAMPIVDRCRNSARASRHTGTTIMVKMSLALNVTPPKTKLASNGCGRRVPNDWSPKARGRNSPAPVSNCANPMVATVSSRRGAVKNRRMIRPSTRTPSSTAASRPTTSPNQ